MKTQTSKQPEQFESSDFYLSAALLAVGFKFSGVRWEGPKAIFLIEKEAAKKANNFFNGALTVSALDYANSVRNLKSFLKQR